LKQVKQELTPKSFGEEGETAKQLKTVKIEMPDDTEINWWKDFLRQIGYKQ